MGLIIENPTVVQTPAGSPVYPSDIIVANGDYMVSPSSVYYASMKDNGQFFVSRGSDPATSGSNVAWSTPDHSLTSGYIEFPFRGQADIRSFNTGNIIYERLGDRGSGLGAVYSLGDNGAFTIHDGTSTTNLGRQLFSNGVDDPVVALSLSGLKYDISNPTIKTSNPVTAGTFRQTNNTATIEQYPVSLDLQYTKTSSWDFQLSEAITLGVKSTFDVGVPGLGEIKSEISLSETTTITGGSGGSESERKAFTSSGDITVPAHSTYETTLTGTTETFDVPFTYDGVARYRSGATATVHGAGVFSGGDTGIFTTVTNCISTPGGCSAAPVSEVPVGGSVPVPEPASLPLLPAALMAVAVIRRLRVAGRPGIHAVPIARR